MLFEDIIEKFDSDVADFDVDIARDVASCFVDHVAVAVSVGGFDLGFVNSVGAVVGIGSDSAGVRAAADDDDDDSRFTIVIGCNSINCLDNTNCTLCDVDAGFSAWDFVDII